MNKRSQYQAIGRREFLLKGSMAAMAVPLLAGNIIPVPDYPDVNPQSIKPEWRNKQDGMVYRQLGRTGLMVSEIVYGTERITPENVRPLEVAIERGINYFDTAPQYGRGAAETAIGKALNTPSKRDKVFIATKLSPFPGLRNRLYREIFDTLPSDKKEAIQKRALEMRKDSGIEKPGYFLIYWPGHPRQLDAVFLSNAMMEEYGGRVEGSPEFKKLIFNTVEESLKRVGTDHFDVLHCPHAATTPSEITNAAINEAYQELRKQGKVRFLGFSTHHNMAALINTAIDVKYFDVVMLAYNVINYGFIDHVLKRAKENGVGLIAMKAAMAVSTPYDPQQVPVPDWRIKKLNQIIPEEMKLQVKAFLWALQNQDLSAVNAGMSTEQMVIENLSVVGKKVVLQPA
jgi:aryl-alcohol dehydrogenase-like predicted oxidoreductase